MLLTYLCVQCSLLRNNTVLLARLGFGTKPFGFRNNDIISKEKEI